MHELEWKRIRSELRWDGDGWFKVFSDTWRLPDGKDLSGFLRIEGRPYVMVVAADEQRRLLVMEGYRPGCEQVVLQFPAGYVEEGEPSLQSAQRELREEAKLTATDWHHLGSFYGDGNWKVKVTHCYLAQGLTPVQEPVDSDDPGPYRLSYRSLDEVRTLWRTGQFPQAAATAALGLALDHLA